ILKDLDKAPIYKGHISPSFKAQFTSSFKNALSFLENNRVKTIIFDNSIEESQEKIDFIQQIYNDFKDIPVTYLEKNEAISQKLFQAIEDEVNKSLVKKLPVLFDFILRDILIVDSLDENKNIEKNFKNVMKSYEIIFVKSIESIKNQLDKHVFKLVIIDTSHFGQKGEAFIKTFKENHPETKLGLVVPPKEHKNIKQKGLSTMFDFLAFKPIKESSLMEIIKNNISNPLLNNYQPYKAKEYYLYLFKENEEVKEEYDNLVESDLEKSDKNKKSQGDILIIDSSDSMGMLLKGILSKGGYSSHQVKTSKEAFEFIKENKIDLIISDWYLKDITGIELFNILNHSPGNKGVPFILMSSKTSEEYEILEPKDKPDGLLGKPFSDSECLSLIQNILKLKENISLSEWRKKLLDVEKENARQLDKEVKERTDDIQNILDSLSHSIFCINEELIAIPPISNYSKELFGESIEGKSIFDILFVDYDKKSENYSLLVNSFELMFGEDEKQFLLVEDYLPKEINYAGRDKNQDKTLKIVYKPIFDQNGILDKVLFVIEDYTKLKNYYQGALNDQLEFSFYKDI
ncbi:MAG: response regulator, partial [Bdellovibrionota bacterium]|nr:response regulator [Bdellovibrionota bacterium]